MYQLFSAMNSLISCQSVEVLWGTASGLLDRSNVLIHFRVDNHCLR